MEVITTEDEYHAVMERFSEIFWAEEGSPEEEELKCLVPLIVKWEKAHYDLGPPIEGLEWWK